jgi:hypothetical protein
VARPLFFADFRGRITCLFRTQFPSLTGRFFPDSAAFERRVRVPGSGDTISNSGFRAGSPQGLLTGAPKDPDVHINASGSSRCGISPSLTSRRADAVPTADKSEVSRDHLSTLNHAAWTLAVYPLQGRLRDIIKAIGDVIDSDCDPN